MVDEGRIQRNAVDAGIIVCGGAGAVVGRRREPNLFCCHGVFLYILGNGRLCTIVQRGCVAPIMVHNRDEAMSFLNIKNKPFAALYCEVHSAEIFPTQTHPPLGNTTPPPAMQKDMQTMRVGSNLDSLSLSEDGDADPGYRGD